MILLKIYNLFSACSSMNMCANLKFFLVVLLSVTVLGDKSDDDAIHQWLPRFYDIENLFDCQKEGNSFCEAKVTLQPKQQDSKIWKYIVESKNNKYKFDKDKFYRGLCVPSEFSQSHDDIENFIKNQYNKQLSNSSLEIGNVHVYSCRDSKEKKMTSFQHALLNGIILYTTFIIFATFYDITLRKKDYSKSGVGLNKYILAFSLIANNEKLLTPIQNSHYTKLKCMQGIRTYNAMLVVMGHSLLNYFLMFVSNPEFIEQITSTRVKLFFTWGMFLVQPFFLITGWLTMVYFHKLMDTRKNISVMDLVGALVMRVLRLWPTLIFSLLIHASGIMGYYFKGGMKHLLENDKQMCQTRWWSTLFFFSNLYEVKDMCNLASWYLSADFQVFIGFLIGFIVILKFKLPVLRSLIGLFCIVSLTQMVVMYINNIDVIYRVSPEKFLLYNMLDNPNLDLYIWYTSALSNAPSFIIGLIFGSIFYQYPDKKFFNNQFMKIIWFLCFFAVPFYAIYLGTDHYDRLYSAIFGALLKPLYSFGIAVGILGMSQGVGGFVKRFCELRFAQILGPLTYSIYLVQLMFVFDKCLSMTSLESISYTKMIISAIKNTIQSIAGGYVVALTIDLPWKKFIFQIRNPATDKEKY